MAHVHGSSARGRSRGRLTTALVATAALFVVEVAGGVFSGSLSLLADAGHMLTDAGGLALALFAIWIAARPPTPEKTWGYYRAEILAALVNALVLLAVAGGILYEAYRRILAPPEVLGGPMLAVAAIGFATNMACAWLLRDDASASLNVRGAYLHVLGDALASIGVMVAAAIVLGTGFTLADPLASVAIALVIVPRTWTLLRQAVNVLLEGTPPHLDTGEIEEAMRGVAGVLRVHDLHVWELTSGREAMSAHVVVEDVGESDRLLRELHGVLHARFGIDHTTIQIEAEPPVVLRIRGSGPV